MRRAFNFLSSYLQPFRLQIIIIFVSIIIVSSTILGLGRALKFLVDQGFSEQNQLHLNYAFLLLLGMIILLALASYNRSFRVNWICEQLEAAIKKDAFKNIINISPSYFEVNKVSDVMSRLTVDLGLVSSSIIMVATSSLRNSIMAIGGFIMLMLCSFKLTSYVLIALPFVLLPIIKVGRRIRQLSKDNQHNISGCNARIEETFSFLKIVQAYNREEFEVNRFTKLLDNTLLLAQKRIKLRSIFFALAIGLILAAIAFVLWIGGHDVLAGKMTAGSLSSFIFYSVIVASSLGGLSEAYSDFMRSVGALDRVIEVINAKSNVAEAEVPIKLNQIDKLNLSIENLSFCYPTRPEIKALNDISLKIEDHATIAIVGPSGAGKSSIFQLLLRFYDPSSGAIKLNNIDIKNVSLEELRSQFALVSQEPIIFSASAYDNILYGNVLATKEEVEEAAKNAEIYDFLMSLPDGFNTYLGERGMKISGGQKQRITIARAILRNPKILLLDEATSSLDSENEKLVQVALEKLRENRTTLVIAHRISTIINADLIIVLDQGKLIEQGTHKELLKKSELYQRLYTNL